jgi:hypothetical protein
MPSKLNATRGRRFFPCSLPPISDPARPDFVLFPAEARQRRVGGEKLKPVPLEVFGDGGYQALCEIFG